MGSLESADDGSDHVLGVATAPRRTSAGPPIVGREACASRNVRCSERAMVERSRRLISGRPGRQLGPGQRIGAGGQGTGKRTALGRRVNPGSHRLAE